MERWHKEESLSRKEMKKLHLSFPLTKTSNTGALGMDLHEIVSGVYKK